jgi:hypothetical protein
MSQRICIAEYWQCNAKYATIADPVAAAASMVGIDGMNCHSRCAASDMI